jgi:hypothetical protein
MGTSTSLRAAVLSNASFSLLSGLTMLFAPNFVGDMLGFSWRHLYQFLGCGLLIFALALLALGTGRRPSTVLTLVVCLADLAWVLGSVMVLGLYGRALSSGGIGLVLATALAVCSFCIWQLRAISAFYLVPERRTYRHCIAVETPAPAQDMWRVLGDLGAIQQYMSSLAESKILDGRAPGVGAVRYCADISGKHWKEECTDFDDGESFAVRFMAEEPDFPFPARTMRGGWSVIRKGAGSQVTVWWELTFSRPWEATLVMPMLSWRADRDFPAIIQRMTAAAIGHVPSAAEQIVVRHLRVAC